MPDAHFDFGNKIMLLLSILMKMKIKLKGSVFLDVIPRNPVKVNQHFGGTCHLHFQGQSVSQEKKKNISAAADLCLLASCLAYSSTVKLEAVCSSETLDYAILHCR
jgi:hypothetical protein